MMIMAIKEVGSIIIPVASGDTPKPLCRNKGIKNVIIYNAMEFMPPAINAAT